MDYQKFVDRLPSLYENWGQESVHPKNNRFQPVKEQVTCMTTVNVMQLLNFAVSCMEADEVYCEVGTFQGGTLVGALLDRPGKIAYAVDNFSLFDTSGENFKILNNNLSKFGLTEQVIFNNQSMEDFFINLEKDKTYDGAHDYRSQLLGLMFARPFFAQQALIVVDDTNWVDVNQANKDFIATHPQCELLLDLPTAVVGCEKTFWNGIQVLSWDANRE
jgi:protein O-GlcNAc transferase